MLTDDPEFGFLFKDHEGLVDPERLSIMGLFPDPGQVHRALQLICLELTTICDKNKGSGCMQFGFNNDESFHAASWIHGPSSYTITFSLGMYKRMLALFRQLTLTNAFGKYSQWTPLNLESLEILQNLDGIHSFRLSESNPPIDALINLSPAPAAPIGDLLPYITRPALDSKHKFDMLTLMIPALVFAFWHEVAHVIYGHLDWQEAEYGMLGIDECGGLEGAHPQQEDPAVDKFRRGLEYLADEFAARRIALDVLRSAHVESEHYVLGPFWFNRENFNTFGQMEGFPDEKVEFNLEGFMYRISFALIGLMLQFEGFFQAPILDHKRQHPHAEVRISHIVDCIVDQLNGGFGINMNTYLGNIWQDQFGYAIQTAELALKACNASRTPIRQNGRMIGAMFHIQEIQAKTKRSGQEARETKEMMAEYAHPDLIRFLNPSFGISFPLPPSREHMLGFDLSR